MEKQEKARENAQPTKIDPRTQSNRNEGSGKGGVGKSTLSTSLASSVKKRI